MEIFVEERASERCVSVRTRWLFGSLLSVLCLPIVVGCSGPRHAAPVDSVLAEQTLAKVLDQWKQGMPIEQCQQLQPAVVVQELYWSQGMELDDYQIISSEARDANLFVTAELELREEGGRERTEEVVYCIGTDPVLTVFRALM